MQHHAIKTIGPLTTAVYGCGNKHNFTLGLHKWVVHWIFNGGVVTAEATVCLTA